MPDFFRYSLASLFEALFGLGWGVPYIRGTHM